jgi:hypothetical protein
MKQSIAVILLLSINAVAQQSLPVSLIALIAAPERYHGKKVVVSGYMYLQRERSALYLGKADFQHSLFKNSLYLEVPNQMVVRLYPLNGCYVEVTGTFDGKHTGHMGAFSGELIVKGASPVWTGTVPADAKDSSNPVSCK